MVTRTLYGWLLRGKWFARVWRLVGCGQVYGVPVAALSSRALMKVRVDKVPIVLPEACFQQDGARLVRSGPRRVSRSISVSLPSPHAAPCHLVGPSVCLSARSLCSGRHCRTAFARSKQGPNGSGCAVREGNGHQFHGFSGEHLPQPVVPCRSVATGRDDTHGTEVKQATDVSVSHLRYLAQPFLAAAGMGFGRQTQA